jgi:hypothetical protein
MIMLPEQNALMARLVWEQQIHICDLNERYLQMVEEKKRLTERDDISIQNDIFDIADCRDYEKSRKVVETTARGGVFRFNQIGGLDKSSKMIVIGR